MDNFHFLTSNNHFFNNVLKSEQFFLFHYFAYILIEDDFQTLY